MLREEHIEVADPPSGRVRVRVAAVGLNPADWALCGGLMAGDLPRGIGYATGPSFADELASMGALVTAYGDGMAARVRDRAGGTVDLVFDASPPNAGSIPELIATVDDPSRVIPSATTLTHASSERASISTT